MQKHPSQLFLNSFFRVNLKMPCLLTNSWTPGISVSEAAPLPQWGVLELLVFEGGLGPFRVLPNVCNTTSEVCNLKAKEEPQQPRTCISYFYVTRLASQFVCFLSLQFCGSVLLPAI